MVMKLCYSHSMQYTIKKWYTIWIKGYCGNDCKENVCSSFVETHWKERKKTKDQAGNWTQDFLNTTKKLITTPASNMHAYLLMHFCLVIQQLSNADIYIIIHILQMMWICMLTTRTQSLYPMTAFVYFF